MTREDWLKQEIGKLRAGQSTTQRCILSTPERIDAGLCLGEIPMDRLRRGADTCSPACQSDKRRIRRNLRAATVCRTCGHALPKKQRKESEPLRTAQHATQESFTVCQ